MKRKAQSEMIGFILIVVLTVVAMLIFLIFSIRTSDSELSNDQNLNNLLLASAGYTTNCALIAEPKFVTYEELIKACYNNGRCANLNKMACDYLNETTESLFDSIWLTEGIYSAYELKIYYQSEDAYEAILGRQEGNCTGKVSGAKHMISLPFEDDAGIYMEIGVCEG